MSRYMGVFNHFNTFRDYLDLANQPVEEVIDLFVANEYLLGKQASTIRSELSAIYSISLLLEKKVINRSHFTARILKGIERLNQPNLGRYPITCNILSKLMHGVNALNFSYYDNLLYKTMFSWCYFACLRISELAVVPKTNHTLRAENVVFLVKDGTGCGGSSRVSCGLILRAFHTLIDCVRFNVYQTDTDYKCM